MPDKLERPLWRGRTNVDALTIACVEHAERIGGHEFIVTQGSYQAGAGDPLSAGTHDLGGVVDLRWCGHDACIRALRQAGMAAWHRTPWQGPWPDHVHAVVIGHPKLADSAARQVQAYLDGRNGLASNGPDDGPRLDPIPRPVWPPHQEDIVASLEQLENVLDRKLRPIVNALGPDGVIRTKLVRVNTRLARANTLLREVEDGTGDTKRKLRQALELLEQAQSDSESEDK